MALSYITSVDETKKTPHDYTPGVLVLEFTVKSFPIIAFINEDGKIAFVHADGTPVYYEIVSPSKEEAPPG